jgi:AraC-like DNA-binding protein
VVVDEYLQARPAGALAKLAPLISGWRQQGVGAGNHRGLPSPYLTFIVTIDDPLVIAGHPDPRQAPSEHWAMIGGLHTSPALITHDGRQAGVQLSVDPLACRALFGLPAGELAGLDVDASDVLPMSEELHHRTGTATSWTARFRAVEAVLGRQASEATVPDEIRRAWSLLLRSGGRVAVQQLADDVGWSTRHLSQRFQQEVGLSPKAAARVIRFDRLRRRLPGPLLELSLEHGYYDQAHLTREFRELAGCSPTTWMNEELRFIQDGPVLEEAGSDT